MKQHRYFAISLICIALIGIAPYAAAASQVRVEADIAYKSGDGLDAYEKERCKLDLYLPEGRKDFPTIVWFHGGSIQAGSKEDPMTVSIARHFAGKGIATALVNYRLSPKVHFPAYIEDAAASVAWVVKNIERFGGDAKRVFVSGHSAGGYLTAMVGMDERYLKACGLQTTDLAGYIPVSGQMIDHSTVREERGFDGYKPIVDEAAPSFHARKGTAPFLNIAGSNDLPARAAENIFFVEAMKAAGSDNVEYMEFDGRDHGTIVSRIPEGDDPVAKAIEKFVERR